MMSGEDTPIAAVVDQARVAPPSDQEETTMPNGNDTLEDQSPISPQQSGAEGSPAPEKTSDTPLSRLHALRRQEVTGQTVFEASVLRIVGGMEKYGAIATADRLEILARMPLAELKAQPEYQEYDSKIEQENRSIILTPEKTAEMTIKVDELKKRYPSMTTQEAFVQMEKDERERLIAAAKASRAALSKPPDPDKTPDEVDDEAELELEATVEARTRVEAFKQEAIMMLGQFWEVGLESSDFGTFMDNFLGATQSRSSTWDGYRRRGLEATGGEIVWLEDIQKHLSSKREFVEVLHDTFVELKRHEPPLISDHPSGLQKESWAELSDEQIKEYLEKFNHLLQDPAHQSVSLECFEKALLLSMRRNPEKGKVDDRVILYFKELNKGGKVFEDLTSSWKKPN